MATTRLLSHLLLIVFLSTPISSFLFPDITLRTGTSGSRYRVSVLQEGPFLYKNGSGYVPDLLRQIAQTYKTLYDEEEFVYELVPVKSWNQLLTRAKTGGHWQMSFGLIVPSLELTNWNWKSLQTSVPTLYTTLKLVARRKKADSESMVSTRQQLNDKYTVVVQKSSPVEHLLLRANKYRGQVRSADSLDEALEYIRSNDDAVLLTNAGVADDLVNKAPYDLQSLCPTRIPGSGMVYYGFYTGKESKMMTRLNEVIVQLLADDRLLSLYTHNFPATHQCSW